MKKIIISLSVILLCVGMASCSKVTPTADISNIPEGPFGKYEPGITLTSVRDIPNPAVVKYPDGDDEEKNAWIRSIKADMGIDVQYE